MDIIRTTIIKTAEEVTANAAYSLEFTVTNDALIKVQASVFTLPALVGGEKSHIGYVIFENGHINCALPGNIPIAKIFEDFDIFLELINEEITLAQTQTQTSQEK